MTSFLDPLIALVSAHAWLAYLTLFLAALLEAVPVIGALVPGSTIILALSALVPGGELNLWGVLASAIAGAMIGDGTAPYLSRPSLAARNPQRLAAGELSKYRCAERDGSSTAGALSRCFLRVSYRRSGRSCRSRRGRLASSR